MIGYSDSISSALILESQSITVSYFSLSSANLASKPLSERTRSGRPVKDGNSDNLPVPLSRCQPKQKRDVRLKLEAECR